MAGHRYNILSNSTNSSLSLPTIEEEEEKDISTAVQEVKRFAKATFLGLILCLSWNLIAVTTLWIHRGIETRIVYLAIAYLLLLGVPAAYWDHKLGLALQGENGFVFHRFSCFYMFQIAFCNFAFFDPLVEKSLTGMGSWMALQAVDDRDIVGIMYVIGSLLFFSEYLISFLVLCRVHELYLQGVFSPVDDDEIEDLESVNGCKL